MSTQTYTNQQTPHQQLPDQQGGGRSSFRIWIAAIGAVLVAGIVALCVALAGSPSIATPAASGTPSSTSAPTTSGSSSSPAVTPVTPAHPVTPVQPSAAVETLQRQLGQLNYYEGPVDGVMGPQTIAAIKDLQRQAGLPQTGQMNAATQAALANYLAHGNNQMGGNS
jgi:Putative peptidoglycan binding domain